MAIALSALWGPFPHHTGLSPLLRHYPFNFGDTTFPSQNLLATLVAVGDILHSHQLMSCGSDVIRTKLRSFLNYVGASSY